MARHPHVSLLLVLVLMVSCVLLLPLLNQPAAILPPPAHTDPLFPLLSVCANSSTPHTHGGFGRKQLLGGFDRHTTATPYVQLLVNAHHTAIERALRLTSPVNTTATATPLTALAWCAQGVAGINYAIAVAAGGLEERVVQVEIFVAFPWYYAFSTAEREAMEAADSVRSQLTRMEEGGSVVELTDEARGAWVEHEAPSGRK